MSTPALEEIFKIQKEKLIRSASTPEKIAEIEKKKPNKKQAGPKIHVNVKIEHSPETGCAVVTVPSCKTMAGDFKRLDSKGKNLSGKENGKPLKEVMDLAATDAFQVLVVLVPGGAANEKDAEVFKGRLRDAITQHRGGQSDLMRYLDKNEEVTVTIHDIGINALDLQLLLIVDTSSAAEKAGDTKDVLKPGNTSIQFPKTVEDWSKRGTSTSPGGDAMFVYQSKVDALKNSVFFEVIHVFDTKLKQFATSTDKLFTRKGADGAMPRFFAFTKSNLIAFMCDSMREIVAKELLQDDYKDMSEVPIMEQPSAAGGSIMSRIDAKVNKPENDWGKCPSCDKSLTVLDQLSAVWNAGEDEVHCHMQYANKKCYVTVYALRWSKVLKEWLVVGGSISVTINTEFTGRLCKTCGR